MPDKMVDEKVCQQWFNNLYKEQEVWLPKVLAASTAHWEITGLHHTPVGFVERQVLQHVLQYAWARANLVANRAELKAQYVIPVSH